jgi:hypothetical protein
VTYSCIAWAIYSAYRRRRWTTIPNLPKQVVEAWVLAGIRYSIELGAPLRAVPFAARAIRIGGSVGSTRRVLSAVVRALHFAWRRRTDGRFADGAGARYLPAREFQCNTGNIEPDRITCIPMVHKRGHCLFGGDYQIITTGRYRATFEMMIRCPSFAHEPVLTLDVHENLQGRGVLVERGIGRSEITRGLQLFSIEFHAMEGNRVEFRVFWSGHCSLSVMGVVFEEIDR